MSDEIYRAVVPVRLLAAAEGDQPDGHVRALVSAYGVKYRIGYATWHTIEMGAFAGSIADQDAIPLFWMHSWSWSEQTPSGDAQAEESEKDGGLVVDGSLYIEDDPSVARLYRALKAGAIREWSIGYRVLAERSDPDDEMHCFVTEAELLEASSVLRGANSDTRTLEVAGTGQPAPTRTRIEIGDFAVETADLALIEQLLGRAGSGEPAEPIGERQPREASTWAASRRMREVFSATTPPE